MPKTKVSNIHRPCEPDKAFWMHDGTIIRSISDLSQRFDGMAEELFRYHVNKDNNKNDFADWIRTACHDEELAMKLEDVLDLKKYKDLLKDHVRKNV